MDAARRRLGAHHGGGGRLPAMRGGGGGGVRGGAGGGGGDDDAAFLRRLRAFFAGDGSGGGSGGVSRDARNGRAATARGRGGGGGGPAARTNAAQRPRSLAADGGRQLGTADWICERCGFTPNFARRRFCFDCGEARPGAAAHGSASRPTSRMGPIGDGGRRPLLAWGNGGKETGRQEVDGPPSRRTPGASVAAIVEEAKRGAARRGAAAASVGGGASHQAVSQPARPKPTVDSDGFVAIGKGGGKPTAAMAASAPTTGGPAEPGGSTDDVRPTPPARTDARDDEEDDGGQPQEDWDLDEDDAPPQGPDELRRRWMQEVALAKKLARQGLPDGHPALIAANAARDAAEAAWRQAKPPAPVATRLRWAQAKLTRALEVAEATRAAITKAEKDHEQLMAQLHDRRCDDNARVRKRQLAVEELQREIGGSGHAERSTGGSAAAALEACGGLCDAVGPELAALAERLPGGSEEQQAVNRVLATLAASQRRAEEAAGLHDAQPQSYDIGDTDEAGLDDMSVASQWSESHELGHDQDTRCAGQASGSADMHTSQSEGAWGDWGHDRWSTAHWRADQHGKWHRSSWADQWEAEHGQPAGWSSAPTTGSAQGARRGGAEHDDESGEPNAKHRRQTVGHTAAAEGASTPAAGDGVAAAAHTTAAAAAAGDYAAQVAEVVNRAIDMGIQPLTSEGHDLITLSPALLARWVSEHIEPGDGR